MKTICDLNNAVAWSLERLRPKQADVIRRRFGFDSNPETLAEIAKSYGCSSAYIRDIQWGATLKLRHLISIYKRLASLGLVP